ncbi:hypothetical protein AB0L66_40530 [Streptomyces sp. NPDC052207]|uniref:hypothetical protein n=1 Tax=Streptomyces sp. NPDC052207 TaxID=3155418 RepID=UPI00341FCD37
MTKKPVILVDGDTTIDWAVRRAQEGFLTSEERLTAECTAHWLWGGAFLLTDLVSQALQGRNVSVLGITPKEKYPAPDDKRVHHSFNTLDKLPRDAKTREPQENAKWRVSTFVGFHRQREIEAYPSDWEGLKCRRGREPHLIVINDSALGFSRANGPWKRIRWLADEKVQQGGVPWVLMNLRLRRIPEVDTLWDSIYRQIRLDKNSPMARKLITLTTADSLRDIGAEISRGLSWEKSALDVIRELQRNPELERVRDCPRLIVSFGPPGALLVDTYNDPPYELLFDTEHTEGSWDRDHSDGRMFGYSQTLTAAVASRIASFQPSPARAATDLAANFHSKLCDGIRHGIKCMHRVFDHGFADPVDSPSAIQFERACMDEDVDTKSADKPAAPRVGQAPIRDPLRAHAKSWSILEEVYDLRRGLDTAVAVVHGGKEALRNVPIGKFEEYISVDRKELEALRSIQNLIAAYLDDKHKSKPRSIAVFGAPGDGKSYAVTQVAKSLGLKERLTFNLSQFESPDNLIGALHQVRDSCLAGDVPLVFWDEFDATLGGTDLGWLRFFLAPMQDGKFQEDQVTHHVGRCIFVFAGGISKNYTEFLGKANVFDSAKVTDFASRLRGYVDVLGVNPPPGSVVDLRVLMRRAILLNEFVGRVGIKKEGGKLDIDEEVINAFLSVPNYQNGTRSMEAIVDMSRLHKGGRFSRSSLPPSTQLELHVDPSEFLHFSSEQ